MLQILHSPEQHAKRSETMREKWKDEKYIENIRIGRSIRPNKPEQIILDLLNQLYPGEWKYTGDYSFVINGKNPDFANINGQKKFIELFGDYWHKGENPQDRIDTFKPFGYDTLVIWEKELKNIKQVKLKVIDFAEAEHG